MPKSKKLYDGRRRTDVLEEGPPPPPEPEPRCCRCKKTRGENVKLLFRVFAADNYVVCSGCKDDEYQARKLASKPWRQKLPPAELLALRLANLDKGRLKRSERIEHIRQHYLTDGIVVNNRQYQVMLMHLGGIDVKDIAVALGYASASTVTNVLKQPHIRAAIEKVERARVERILSGDFGVVAQARQASAGAMKRIVTEVDNDEAKPGERIKAAEDVLKIAGEMVEKKNVHHVYEIVNGMTEAEMEEYLTSRRWPERVRGIVERLGLPAPS